MNTEVRTAIESSPLDDSACMGGPNNTAPAPAPAPPVAAADPPAVADPPAADAPADGPADAAPPAGAGAGRQQQEGGRRCRRCGRRCGASAASLTWVREGSRAVQDQDEAARWQRLLEATGRSSDSDWADFRPDRSGKYPNVQPPPAGAGAGLQQQEGRADGSGPLELTSFRTDDPDYRRNTQGAGQWTVVRVHADSKAIAKAGTRGYARWLERQAAAPEPEPEPALPALAAGEAYLAMCIARPSPSSALGPTHPTSLQEAQRRLAFAAALLPSDMEAAPASAHELDADVLPVVGRLVAAHLAFTQHGARAIVPSTTLMRVASSEAALQSAVCDREMWRGRHYAEFTLLAVDRFCTCHLGVVGPTFDAHQSIKHQINGRSWMFDVVGGPLVAASGVRSLRQDDRPAGRRWVADFDDAREHRQLEWDGQPEEALREGDVVGLLLNLDAQSLTVYVNGVRQGVLVQPGVTDDMFAFSCLPLRWAVELQFASVRIDGPLPPPA